MLSAQNREIASAWLAMHHADEGSPTYLNNFWAYEELDQLINTAPDKSSEIIDEILLIDDSEITVANLAAGPIESLLVEHGDEVIRTIIQRSIGSALWKQLISNIWKNDIKDHIWEQLQQAKSSL